MQMTCLDIHLLICLLLGGVTEAEGKSNHKTDLLTITGIASEDLPERSNRRNS